MCVSTTTLIMASDSGIDTGRIFLVHFVYTDVSNQIVAYGVYKYR